jgi:hypothetical protein
MAPYTVVVAIHVLVAVVGVGLIGAIPIAARVARRAADAGFARRALFDVLFRCTRVSLATMVLTGGFLDFSAGGAFHSRVWFRASVALLVVAVFALVRARAALHEPSMTDAALRQVERWGWASCATVALMAVLMEVKPFQ